MRPVAQGSYIFLGMEASTSNSIRRRLITYDLDIVEWSLVVLPMIHDDSDIEEPRARLLDIWIYDYSHNLARLIPGEFYLGLILFMPL